MTTAIPLSARESEVLAELATHSTNAEIAARLFISVRTVESHVAALLRKTGAADRRELATLGGASRDTDDAAMIAPLPVPASSFIGRATELADLSSALGRERLVTALGPGGIGKTRLALSIASEVRGRFPDGDCYVDLVPVTHPAAIAPAIVTALGLGDQQGRTPEEIIARWLAPRRTLLVLDNCEHMLDGVADLLERLLAECPKLVVLATSRARLGVAGEWVFAVRGLSVDEAEGDAVELFLARARAAGDDTLTLDRRRVAAICRTLDGSALAIELAAARIPSLGLDGVESGLMDDRLDLLMSGRRSGSRHRSLRATLNWSVELLSDAERAVLRRISVFAGAFSADAAAAVLEGWAPTAASARGALADLADQSLLVARPVMGGMRYRALETVRQFGDRALDEAGETDEAHARHLAWCRERATALPLPVPEPIAAWRQGFDEIADDVRAAVTWAARHPGHARDAEDLAGMLAGLSFARGRPAEAQRMYELAAHLADSASRVVRWTDLAAGAAEFRHFGDDAMQLRRVAADLARDSGDLATAAWQLARSSELISRAPGIMARPPELTTALPLIDEARELAGDDVHAMTRILIAEASVVRETHPDHRRLTDIALAAARAEGDTASESAALDQSCVSHLSAGDAAAAAADSIARVALLDSAGATAETGLEYPDALLMAVECCCGIGDLAAADRYAERMLTLLSYAEEPHLATSRALLTTALSGDVRACLALSERFREGWDRSGRPAVGSLALSARAVESAAALTGDGDLAAEWSSIAIELRAARPNRDDRISRVFSALAPLHRGLTEEALALTDVAPDVSNVWYDRLWEPWYVSYWCEAAVLADAPDAADRIRLAGPLVAVNPVATAIVDRAAALVANQSVLPTIAERLETAGAHYQAARTRVMAGDPAGAEWMRAAGIIEMAWPV